MDYSQVNHVLQWLSRFRVSIALYNLRCFVNILSIFTVLFSTLLFLSRINMEDLI